MTQRVNEWLKQSDYDYQVAKSLYEKRHYIYTAFMCHFAIEKALMGLLEQRLKESPPWTHDLIYLSNKSQVMIPDEFKDFIAELNKASTVTRYPAELAKLKKIFAKQKAGWILIKTGDFLRWIKKTLKE